MNAVALQGALSEKSYSVAVVSIPHSEHDEITRALIAGGVSLIIKEKPLAWTSKDALIYRTLTYDRKVKIVTTTQRMVTPTFEKGIELLPQIGTPISFNYDYHFALPKMTSGWRSMREKALGGVLLDMGSHALHYLNSLFGQASEAKGEFSYLYPKMKEMNLEDRVMISLSYGEIKGILSINRHAESKKEELVIRGTKGKLEISSREAILYDLNGIVLERFSSELSQGQRIKTSLDS